MSKVNWHGKITHGAPSTTACTWGSLIETQQFCFGSVARPCRTSVGRRDRACTVYILLGWRWGSQHATLERALCWNPRRNRCTEQTR